MHILQLLAPFLRTPYVEIVEPRLPESRQSGAVKDKGSLAGGAAFVIDNDLSATVKAVAGCRILSGFWKECGS
jgi:hypothetical protein